MSYIEMQEHFPEIDAIQESYFNRVKEAYIQAVQEGIKVNSILINKNMVKVPSFPMMVPGTSHFLMTPDMVCGLNVYWTKDELPEGYSFALLQGPENRLAQFESIGMEPDELRKAAEFYKRVKEII